jgi:hypothetical protein
MHGGAGDDLYRVDSIADMVSRQTIDISNPSQVESLNLHIDRAVGATSGTAFSIAARSAVGSLNGERLPGFSTKPARLTRLVAVHGPRARFDR